MAVATVDEVNAIMKEASESKALKGILNYNKAPLVSIDFNHDPASSTFDSTLTKVSGRLVKVFDVEVNAAFGIDPSTELLDFELGAKYAARRMDNPPETYLRCKVAFRTVPLLPTALPDGTASVQGYIVAFYATRELFPTDPCNCFPSAFVMS